MEEVPARRAGSALPGPHPLVPVCSHPHGVHTLARADRLLCPGLGIDRLVGQLERRHDPHGNGDGAHGPPEAPGLPPPL